MYRGLRAQLDHVVTRVTRENVGSLDQKGSKVQGVKWVTLEHRADLDHLEAREVTGYQGCQVQMAGQG